MSFLHTIMSIFHEKKKLDKTLKNKEVKEDREMGGSYLQSP